MTKMIRPQAFQQKVLRALMEHGPLTAYNTLPVITTCKSLDQASNALNALYLRGYVSEDWQGAVPVYTLTAQGKKWIADNLGDSK